MITLPTIIGLIVIIIINFLIGLGKSKIINIFYILLSFMLFIFGMANMQTDRNKIYSKLYIMMHEGHINSDFYSWAIDKYRLISVTSLLVTYGIIIVVNIILNVCSKKKESIMWTGLTIYINVFRIILLITGILYSYGTINKLFDIAGYIINLSIYECLMLYYPLLTKRIIILRDKRDEQNPSLSSR